MTCARAGLAVALGGLISCATPPPRADPPPAAWERLAPAPVAVLAPAGSVSGRRWIVTGGIRASGAAAASVQVFDLDAHQWSTPARLAHPRFMHAQVTIDNGRALVIGGRHFIAPAGAGRPRDEPLATCEIVDGDRVMPAAALPAAIATPTAHRLRDGRVIALGSSIATLYDPRVDRWSPPIRLHEPRRSHASILLDDGRVLIVGGHGRNSLEILDPRDGAGALLRSRLPVALDDTALARIPGGRVLIIGGQVSATGNTTNRTWLIDPAADRIDDGPPLGPAAGLADHLVLRAAAGIVVIGGESQKDGVDTELRAAWLIDPASLAHRRLPDTADPHDDAAAALDGTLVLVTGGTITTAPLPLLPMVRVPQPVSTTEALHLAARPATRPAAVGAAHPSAGDPPPRPVSR